MRGPLLLTCCVILLPTSFSLAQKKKQPLDLLPAHSAICMQYRNPDALEKKMQAFAQGGGMLMGGFIPPIGAMGLGIGNIEASLDKSRDFSMMIASPSRVKNKINPGDFDELQVMRLPFTKLEPIAKAFKVKPEVLASGNVVGLNVNTPFGRNNKGVGLVKDKWLYLAQSEKALRGILESPSLSNKVLPTRLDYWNRADVFMHVDFKEMGNASRMIMGFPDVDDVYNDLRPEEQQGVKKIIERVKTIPSMRMGMSIDEGIGVSVVGAFPSTVAEPMKKFWASLAGPEGKSTLHGLPEKDAVFAFAMKTDCDSLLPVHALEQYLQMAMGMKPKQTPKPKIDVVGALWKQINAVRLAIYRNANPESEGLLSAVIILDVEKPVQLITGMVVAAGIPPAKPEELESPKKKTVSKAEIQKWIANLSARRFQLREQATNKLREIGESILPFLEQVIKANKDAEAVRRAKDLKMGIVGTTELNPKNLPLLIQQLPAVNGFSFISNVRQSQKHQVDVIHARKAKEANVQSHLWRTLLGPRWNQIQFVTRKNQIVIVLGSNDNRLSQTLTNLNENKAGLEKDKRLIAFQKQSEDQRRIEVHMSLGQYVELFDVDTQKKLPKGLQTDEFTSYSFTVTEKHLALDVWLPQSELSVINTLSK